MGSGLSHKGVVAHETISINYRGTDCNDGDKECATSSDFDAVLKY